MCWINAVLFEFLVLLKVVGIIVGAATLVAGFILGCDWLADKCNASRYLSLRAVTKVAKWSTIAVVSLFALLVVVALTVEIKDNVCAKGFGPYWHEFWSNSKETK